MFSLKNKNIIITGGGGFLARNFIKGILEYGGNPIILENSSSKIIDLKKYFNLSLGKIPDTYKIDISNWKSVKKNSLYLKKKYKKIDGLINNAARNPIFENKKKNYTFENFNLVEWNNDCKIGLTGSIICTQIYGTLISKNKNGGSILNISSDLGLISPDQRLYRSKRKKNFEKPVSYSVVKSGLIGLTKFTSTYWANKKVRCNCICPGGVENKHDRSFLNKISRLIPLGRLAKKDEYNGLVVFLMSDASSYINGATISADGGRTAW